LTPYAALPRWSIRFVLPPPHCFTDTCRTAFCLKRLFSRAILACLVAIYSPYSSGLNTAFPALGSFTALVLPRHRAWPAVGAPTPHLSGRLCCGHHCYCDLFIVPFVRSPDRGTVRLLPVTNCAAKQRHCLLPPAFRMPCLPLPTQPQTRRPTYHAAFSSLPLPPAAPPPFLHMTQHLGRHTHVTHLCLPTAHTLKTVTVQFGSPWARQPGTLANTTNTAGAGRAFSRVGHADAWLQLARQTPYRGSALTGGSTYHNQFTIATYHVASMHAALPTPRACPLFQHTAGAAALSPARTLR